MCVRSVDTGVFPHLLPLKYLLLSRGCLFPRPCLSVTRRTEQNSTLFPAAFASVIVDEQGSRAGPPASVFFYPPCRKNYALKLPSMFYDSKTFWRAFAGLMLMKNRKCRETIFISESGANELRAANADKREAEGRGSDGSAGNAMQTIEQWCRRRSGGLVEGVGGGWVGGGEWSSASAISMK